MMLTLNVYYRCNPGQRDAFYKELCDLGIHGISNGEKGNVKYDYFFDVQDPDVLLLIETWESQEDLTAHSSTETFAKLQALKGVYCADVKLDRFDY